MGAWAKNMAVQIGKTKIFMREDVVKQLESARDAVWTEGVCGLQRAVRVRLARRTVKLARQHVELAAKVHAALGAKAVADASAALEQLNAAWVVATLSVATAPALRAMQREAGLLDVQLQALQEQEKAELEACNALMEALAAKEFVGLKVSLQVAQETSQGVRKELVLAMAEAEAAIAVCRPTTSSRWHSATPALALLLLTPRSPGVMHMRMHTPRSQAETQRTKDAEAEAAKAATGALSAVAEAEATKRLNDFKKWEAEVEAKAAERMKARKAAEAAVSQPDVGEGMESLTIQVRNDTRPEKGVGVEMNSMNAITAILKGGFAAKDNKLRVGDIVTSVDGISVKGKKARARAAADAPLFTRRPAPALRRGHDPPPPPIPFSPRPLLTPTPCYPSGPATMP